MWFNAAPEQTHDSMNKKRLGSVGVALAVLTAALIGTQQLGTLAGQAEDSFLYDVLHVTTPKEKRIQECAENALILLKNHNTRVTLVEDAIQHCKATG